MLPAAPVVVGVVCPEGATTTATEDAEAAFVAVLDACAELLALEVTFILELELTASMLELIAELEASSELELATGSLPAFASTF